MRYRIEKDGLGKKQIPAEAYYGIGSLRSKDTFQITKHGLSRQMIKALAIIKKSAAKVNVDLGIINEDIANAISLSCDEIINGRLHGQFITDVIQGGSGASMNANANEVIANRANEMMGGEKGKYDLVHPTKHVNLGQNTIEVIVIAGKISVIRLMKKLITESKKLYNAYIDKISQSGLLKDKGLGLELHSFASVLERDMKKIEISLVALREITINSKLEDEGSQKKHIELFVKHIASFSGENFVLAKNHLDGERNLDSLTWASSTLKIAGANLAKVGNDLLLLSQNEGLVISKQISESNSPVVIEMLKLVSFYIMGNDLTISRSVESGELEGNIYLPIIFACMFEMLNLIRRSMRIFREKVIEELVIKEE